MNRLLVMQSDFGLSDGAVAAMCGVALSVDEDLKIFHLTHDIPPFDTYEASYRLFQAVPFWPEGTVFVTVVDPGVGSNRRNVVAVLPNPSEAGGGDLRGAHIDDPQASSASSSASSCSAMASSRASSSSWVMM